MRRKSVRAIIFLCTLFSACSAPVAEIPTETAPSPIPDATLSPTATIAVAVPTQNRTIITSDQLDDNSPFCQPGDEDSPFILSCTENTIQFTQSETRRGSDIILERAIDTDTYGFSLLADVTSNPADPARLDKNQIGFYFKTKDERTFALRLEGQFFNFEEWAVENGKEKTVTLNQTYAPQLLSAGRVNNLRLTCVPENCDLFASETLVGRLPLTETKGFSVIGLFAASPWDEKFGSASIESLIIEAISAAQPETQPFTLIDDLSADHDTFSQMGLSGAFSDFENDGFHFSPVIPYGYYAAKAGPALRNMSVSVTVDMDFSPGVPATQYGGVVCRASNEGMVMAVLRADATYTIYRDSVRRAFAMLATDTIPTITEGRSEHRLRLDCIDDTIALYIDGTEVDSFIDTKFAIQYGRGGLYTKAGGAAYSDAIIFSDLEIREVR